MQPSTTWLSSSFEKPFLYVKRELLNFNDLSISKQKITGALIQITLWIIILTAINLGELIAYPEQRGELVGFLRDDLIIIGLWSLLYWLNCSRYASYAGILLLLCMVGGISFCLDFRILYQVLLFYALPVLASSFILKPKSSFLFAGVSTLGYSIAFGSRQQLQLPDLFNFFILFLFAALSSAVAEHLNQMIKQLQVNETRLKSMVTLFQMQNASPQEVTDQTLEEGIRLTQSQFGYLAFIQNDESTVTTYAWSRSALDTCHIKNAQMEHGSTATGLWSEAVRQRRAVITNNYLESNPFTRGVPKGHVSIYRCLNVPFIEGERVVAVIGVANKEQTYNEADVDQLLLLMNELWSLLQRKKMISRLEESNQELSEAYEATLSGWAHALEIHNKDTEEHSRRVIELSMKLAQTVGLQEDELIHFRRGVLLHDIGKMGIPDFDPVQTRHVK